MRRPDAAACGVRDGRGCRSYSWPRAPPSLCARCSPLTRGSPGSWRERWPGAPWRGRPCVMAVGRQSVIGAHVGAATCQAAGRVESTRPSGVRTIRCRSRLARRSGTRRRSGSGRESASSTGRRRARRAYDSTSLGARPRRHRVFGWCLGGRGGRRLVAATLRVRLRFRFRFGGIAVAAAIARRRRSRRPCASAWASGRSPASAVLSARIGDRVGGYGRMRSPSDAASVSAATVRAGRGLRRRRPSLRRPRRRCGCRSASRSAVPQAGRSDPRGRWPARASARERSRSRCGAPRRCRPR